MKKLIIVSILPFLIFTAKAQLSMNFLANSKVLLNYTVREKVTNDDNQRVEDVQDAKIKQSFKEQNIHADNFINLEVTDEIVSELKETNKMLTNKNSAFKTKVPAIPGQGDVQLVKSAVKYPALPATAGYNDLRVAPWHAFQSASTDFEPPFLLQTRSDQGAYASNRDQLFRRITIEVAYILWQTGHPDFQPKKH